MSHWTPSLDLPASYEASPAVDAHESKPLYFRLPTPVLVAVGVLAALGLLTSNPLLTAASVAVLPLLIAIVWRPGEPPVLPFVLGFHWIQATAKVFHADILGTHVSNLAIYAQFGAFAEIERATWLSLTGLVALAVGIRLAIRTLAPPDEDALESEGWSLSIPKAFWLYFVITFTVTAIYSGIDKTSGFRQIMLGVVQLKWAAYFLVAYLALARREGYAYFFVALGIEFISGIGFFSGFKEVLFLTILAYFTVRSRVTTGTVVKGLVMVLALIVLGATWTAVKRDYRLVISGGGGQGTVVSQSEQVALLVGYVSELDSDDIITALEPAAMRVSYVDFFGYALSTVPTTVPHEDGALWGAAIRHILTPRILFPNKPAIVSDSEITNRYTNLGVAGGDEGTSFSIGYMGESYIDFGPVWMFIPIFLVGVWRGLMYRFFLRKEGMQLMGYAFIVALFSSAYQLEVATGKLLGGITMRFIVLALLFVFVMPRVMEWLRDADAFEPTDVAVEPDDGAALPPLRQVWT